MQKLILNDGTELNNSYAAETIDYIFLYISNGMSMLKIMMLMADPEKSAGSSTPREITKPSIPITPP